MLNGNICIEISNDNLSKKSIWQKIKENMQDAVKVEDTEDIVLENNGKLYKVILKWNGYNYHLLLVNIK